MLGLPAPHPLLPVLQLTPGTFPYLQKSSSRAALGPCKEYMALAYLRDLRDTQHLPGPLVGTCFQQLGHLPNPAAPQPQHPDLHQHVLQGTKGDRASQCSAPSTGCAPSAGFAAKRGANAARHSCKGCMQSCNCCNGEIQLLHGELQLLHGNVQLLHADVQVLHGEVQWLHAELQRLHAQVQYDCNKDPSTPPPQCRQAMYRRQQPFPSALAGKGRSRSLPPSPAASCTDCKRHLSVQPFPQPHPPPHKAIHKPQSLSLLLGGEREHRHLLIIGRHFGRRGQEAHGAQRLPMPTRQPHKKPFQLLFAEALSLTGLGKDKSAEPGTWQALSSTGCQNPDCHLMRGRWVLPKGGKGAALLPESMRLGSYLSRAWLVRLAGMRPGQYASAGTRCPPSQVVCFAELPPEREKGSAQHPAAVPELRIDAKNS